MMPPARKVWTAAFSIISWPLPITAASPPTLATRQFHRKGAAVLAQSDDDTTFADNTPLAGAAIVFEIGIVLLAIGRRHEHLNVLANDLVLFEAEEARSRPAERMDRAVLVDGDDRIWHRVEDGAKPGFAFANRILGRPLLGQIVNDANEYLRAVAASFPDR